MAIFPNNPFSGGEDFPPVTPQGDQTKPDFYIMRYHQIEELIKKLDVSISANTIISITLFQGGPNLFTPLGGLTKTGLLHDEIASN